MTTLLPSPTEAATELLRRRTARTSLEHFSTYVKPDYETNWHHRVLCGYLERLCAGHVKRLMVFMPPRHGKSQLVSRHLPAWVFGRAPDTAIIGCSYSATLASAMNRDVQRLIDSDAYRRLFPETELFGENVRTKADGSYLRNSEVFEVVGHRGVYRAAGRGQGITGLGCDLAIIDDPLKDREEADSPTIRESLWEWYTSTLRTRLAPGGRILLTMTRWHEDDLAGRLLAKAADDPKADQWTVLRLPAVCEEPHDDDPRVPGEVLWPTWFPLTELEKTQANSPYEWAALYQQHPRPQGGTEWPEEYFGPGIWFDDWPLASETTLRVIALDPSKGRGAKHGDYSAYALLAMDREGTLWCDADLAKGHGSPLIVQAGLEHQRRFRADGFAIETNQFQDLLADDFERQAAEQGVLVPVFRIDNRVNKQVRIRRLGPYLAQGRLRFKAESPGAKLLVKQLRDFPSGDHDDGPDALEMALRLMGQLLQGSEADEEATVLRF